MRRVLWLFALAAAACASPTEPTSPRRILPSTCRDCRTPSTITPRRRVP